jgi:hypothetical protein
VSGAEAFGLLASVLIAAYLVYAIFRGERL